MSYGLKAVPKSLRILMCTFLGFSRNNCVGSGGSRRGSLGSNKPPFFFPDLFDLLVRCYSQQCLTLSASSPCNSVQCACSEIIFLRVELCVASAGFVKGGCGHFKFFHALRSHSCKRTPLFKLLDLPLVGVARIVRPHLDY